MSITSSITCLKKSLIAPDVYELIFTKPEGCSYKAGQFVLFDVPLIDNPADLQPRAYSIASAPEEKDLLFVIKLKPGGRASRWVAEVLKEGSVVGMGRALGLFTLIPEDQGHYVFVGTGSGVAPLRSHLVSCLEHRKSKAAMDLIFGVRNREDLFWIDQFETLARKHSNFHFHPTLSAPPADWTGMKGRVTAVMPDIIKDPATTKVFLCGSPAMIADTKKLCIETLQMPKANVHGEGYI